MSEGRRGPVFISAVVVAVIAIALVAVLATRDPAADRVTESPLIGRAAPPIMATALDGGDFDLDDLRGQWVVVNFFATWCTPCRVEHPELVSFQRRHAQVGDATVVSVVFDDEPSDVAAFFEEEGGEWPVLPGEGVIFDWAVAQVPESFLVAPNGLVVARLTGGVTSAGLDALIEEVGAA